MAPEANRIAGAATIKRLTLPTGVTVLRPDQIVTVAADAWITDIDDTVLLGSGEHVHDGPSGRFSGGLRQALRECGVAVDDFEWPGIWEAQFSSFAGLRESQVTEQNRPKGSPVL